MTRRAASAYAEVAKHVAREGECWVWTGRRDRNGYGQVRFRGKLLFAHRLAYQTFVGIIPDRLVVMHSCDTPACCNPAHLRLGTQAENIQDSVSKGRHSSQQQKRSGGLHE